ncbi:MAG: PIN domain-containing protein [Planctomycetes bacterium]|nr:PIN domain-containing protein [Planctomycetota bacterium]
MIVVDASAVADVMLGIPSAEAVAQRLLAAGETLHAPHLLDLELLQVLRRFAGTGTWQGERAAQALDDFAALRIVRHAHEPLRGRIWELRKNLTAYDAAYLALAELLECPLLTRDEKLLRAPGHAAMVLVL